VAPVDPSGNEEDSGFNTFSEEENSGSQDSLKDDYISSQPLKRRRLSFGPTGGSQSELPEEHAEENVEISNFKEMDSQEGLDQESSVKTDT